VKQEGHAPTVNLLKSGKKEVYKNREFKKAKRKAEEKKGEMEPEKYYTLCNQVSIEGTRLCFALCRRRENSCLNFRLQLSTEGSSYLNIRSFLVAQILCDIPGQQR